MRSSIRILLIWSVACHSVLCQAALATADDAFLDEIERASFLFFWEAADPDTGLIKDRSRADGSDAREVASIASTGFGLTALCIAEARKFMPAAAARARVLATLRFIADRLPQEHGFFYHFVDARTGERAWKSEVSSIDTAILLCGVLMCGQHFADGEIRLLA